MRDCPVITAPSSATVLLGGCRGQSRDTQRGTTRSSTIGGPRQVFTMTKRDAEANDLVVVTCLKCLGFGIYAKSCIWSVCVGV